MCCLFDMVGGDGEYLMFILRGLGTGVCVCLCAREFVYHRGEERTRLCECVLRV